VFTFVQFIKENDDYDYRSHVGPRTFDYIRNNNDAKKKFNFGTRFNQHIEPHGRYMLEKPASYKHYPSNELEQGTVHFKNPLVMPWGGSYNEPTNWKNVLHKQYGKKGRALSKALVHKGHDAIITHDPNGHSNEVVDLTMFK
jgi:hypothetical protein